MKIGSLLTFSLCVLKIRYEKIFLDRGKEKRKRKDDQSILLTSISWTEPGTKPSSYNPYLLVIYVSQRYDYNIVGGFANNLSLYSKIKQNRWDNTVDLGIEVI